MGKKKQSDKVGLHLSIAALVIAVLSWLTAVGALSLAIVAYVQTDRPHTLFEESCARLDLLDKKFERAESYIQSWREEGSVADADLLVCEASLAQAQTLRDEAESSLMRYEYEQANEYILQADSLVSSVPAYPAPDEGLQLWLWLAVGVGALPIIGLVFFIVSTVQRKRTGDPPTEARSP
jgi:hypothetical protein